MSRRLSAVGLAVCALISITASAQSRQQFATRIQEIVLEISVIEIAGAQPVTLAKQGNAKGRLTALIGQSKARLITNLRVRTRTAERFKAVVGQLRIPSAFQDKRFLQGGGEPVQAYSPGSIAVWHAAPEDISFIVEGSAVEVTDRLLDITLNLRVTGFDCMSDSFNPMFTERSFVGAVMMKESETCVLMAFRQLGELTSRALSGLCATSAADNILVLLTTRPVR